MDVGSWATPGIIAGSDDEDGRLLGAFGGSMLALRDRVMGKSAECTRRAHRCCEDMPNSWKRTVVRPDPLTC